MSGKAREIKSKGKKRKLDYYFIAALTLALLLFCVSLFPVNKVYLWDEAVYLSTGNNLFSQTPYYTEIDYRPPLLPLLIKLGSLFYDIEMAAHIIISLFFLAGIVSMYFLGKEVFDKKTGLIASILFGLCPFLFHTSKQIMTDMPSASLVALSLFFLFRFKNREKTTDFAFSAIIMGLAVLMRFTSLVVLLPIMLFLFLNKYKLKSMAKYLLYMIMPLIPYFIWAQASQTFFLMPFIKAQIVIAKSGLIADNFYYIKAFYRVAGLVSIIGLFLYLIRLLRSWHPNKERFIRRDLVLVISTIFFLVYLTINPHKELRYFISALPFIFILSAAGFAQFKNKWLNLVIALVVVGALIFPYHRITYYDGRMDLGEDILLNNTAAIIPVSQYIKANMPDGKVAYSHSLYPIIAYYSKKKVFPTWPWDGSFYKEFPKNMKNSGWYIYFYSIDKAPSKEWLDQSPYFELIKKFNTTIIYEYNALPEFKT